MYTCGKVFILADDKGHVIGEIRKIKGYATSGMSSATCSSILDIFGRVPSRLPHALLSAPKLSQTAGQLYRPIHRHNFHSFRPHSAYYFALVTLSPSRKQRRIPPRPYRPFRITPLSQDSFFHLLSLLLFNFVETALSSLTRKQHGHFHRTAPESFA